jgi:hypothetical protein
MVRLVRRQYLRNQARELRLGDGDQIDHHRALAVSAEHQLGVGAVRHHGLNVSVSVAGARRR